MDKRERKARLKEIIELVDEAIEMVKGTPYDIFEEAKDKLEDTFDYMESNCIVPEGFDPEELMVGMIKDYFDNDDEILNLVGQIEGFREEVEERIGEMREGVNKEEWEDFLYNLDNIEEVIDVEGAYITDIESYIEALQELKNNLENLAE